MIGAASGGGYGVDLDVWEAAVAPLLDKALSCRVVGRGVGVLGASKKGLIGLRMVCPNVAPGSIAISLQIVMRVVPHDAAVTRR